MNKIKPKIVIIFGKINVFIKMLLTCTQTALHNIEICYFILSHVTRSPVGVGASGLAGK